MSEFTNAAHQASLLSAEYSAANNKQAWLDLYADDAVIADPVGHYLDPHAHVRRAGRG
jgi:hypothetical protein